jgi:hypothetical protein
VELKILEKKKKMGGKYYIVIGVSNSFPKAYAIFGRYKKLDEAQEVVRKLGGYSDEKQQ